MVRDAKELSFREDILYCIDYAESDFRPGVSGSDPEPGGTSGVYKCMLTNQNLDTAKGRYL
jgi:hypothetical protein